MKRSNTYIRNLNAARYLVKVNSKKYRGYYKSNIFIFETLIDYCTMHGTFKMWHNIDLGDMYEANS